MISAVQMRMGFRHPVRGVVGREAPVVPCDIFARPRLSSQSELGGFGAREHRARLVLGIIPDRGEAQRQSGQRRGAGEGVCA